MQQSVAVAVAVVYIGWSVYIGPTLLIMHGLFLSGGELIAAYRSPRNAV